MEIYDYFRSSLTFQIDTTVQKAITVSHKPPYSLNNARITIECCCEVTDKKNNSSIMYVLGAECKTERVGVEAEIWTEPNAGFRLVASTDEMLIIKNWAHRGIKVMRHPETLGAQPLRQSDLVKKAWSDFRLDLLTTSGKVLDSAESIVQATLDNRQLLAQTDYDDGDFHVCIQHPVKTMNANERDNVYQTDTGPIILPDLSPDRLAQAERRVEVFDVAFSAFNCPQWAEFVIYVPTDVSDQISVDHYSKFRRIDNTRNAIIQID